MPSPVLKLLDWVGGSYEDYRAYPAKVRKQIGYALYVAQRGDKHRSAKPLKGFGGACILETVEDHDGNTYRVVYTVKFAERIYVLHTFQKKSKHGIKTPLHEIHLIERRLKLAEQHCTKGTQKG